MNKKFINALLFSAALLSTGMVSSCKDYDDDIDALETRVTTLEEAMKTLEAKFDAGKFITSFAANSSNTGYVLTLSDGSTLEIKNGENGATGAAGQNGTTWEIDETTKEWVKVNPDGSRENTGIIAEGQKGEQGEQGEPGEPGQPGKDGHSPYINETNQKWMVWNDETGKYEEAIPYLEKFSGDDQMVAPSVKGALGNCYAHKGDLEKAASLLVEAANETDSHSLSPIFLLQAGEIYEKLGKNEEAIKAYQTIKDKYFNSYQAYEIDKYINRASK